jgi:dTMP kinase
MPLFITFEGIEGSGKTTQIRLLAEHFRLRGLPVLATREPGGCSIADAIRQILLHPDNSILDARAELFLYAAARAQHVEEVIRPALAGGTTVLCDRFMDATVAYQGFGRGIDLSLIEHLNDLATAGVKPDLTILLDMPAGEGLQRAINRNTGAASCEDRFERESLDFHSRVREGYLYLACREERFRIVDAGGAEEEVFRRVLAALEQPAAMGSQS